MTHKMCRKCLCSKPISEFHPNKACSLGVTGTCRECNRERINKWYKNNQLRRQEVANEANQRKKRMMVDHFGGKCHDCGGSFPLCVYAFHHLDPSQKDYNPSRAIQLGEEKMWKELDKCVMLCANCHMIRHHGNGV